ncbi:hypothetical protein [Streptosporangium jomthongense]|uniref:Uncharacterized protein n=1 Tax=Streptosporangium jomthongense TaxID=1193683 RepID=A0ABV8F1F4_9ACTN
MVRHLLAAAILAAATMGPVPARAGVPGGGAAEAPWGTISYRKTGGFAGIRQTLVVDGNGLARGGSAGATRTFRLTPAELGSLRQGLDHIRTWSSSTAGCDVPDHFTYTLEYHGRSATRCHEPPADWRPAVARLDEVIARHVTAPATSGD